MIVDDDFAVINVLPGFVAPAIDRRPDAARTRDHDRVAIGKRVPAIGLAHVEV